MKRGMVGGAHRGPVGAMRQRRTIRLVQIILVLIAAGLLLNAGYAWGRVSGYEAGAKSNDLGAPRAPSAAQVVVLGVLGAIALGGAVLLQGREGVRMPTPARLDELAGRAEQSAIERAEAASQEGAADAARPGEEAAPDSSGDAPAGRPGDEDAAEPSDAVKA